MRNWFFPWWVRSLRCPPKNSTFKKMAPRNSSTIFFFLSNVDSLSGPGPQGRFIITTTTTIIIIITGGHHLIE